MKKRIGLVGWWGGRNEGDDFIKHCLVKTLGETFRIRLIEVPFTVSRWNMMRIERLDYLIVGGGGLFTHTPPPPFDSFDRWADRLKIPVGFLGVGVQEISEKYGPVMREILERAQFFVVRDTDSMNLVRSLSTKVAQVPDISFLYPRRIRRTAKPSATGVNLRVWDFDDERTYDHQAWCQAINRLPGEKKTIPLSFLPGVDDRQAMAGLRGTKNAQFDINLYDDLQIVVGMRLHSLIFGVQNSIPAVGIGYAPKVRRFFSEMGLEEFCLEVDEYDRLEETVAEALARKEELVARFGQYTENARRAVRQCLTDIERQIATAFGHAGR